MPMWVFFKSCNIMFLCHFFNALYALVLLFSTLAWKQRSLLLFAAFRRCQKRAKGRKFPGNPAGTGLLAALGLNVLPKRVFQHQFWKHNYVFICLVMHVCMNAWPTLAERIGCLSSFFSCECACAGMHAYLHACILLE